MLQPGVRYLPLIEMPIRALLSDQILVFLLYSFCLFLEHFAMFGGFIPFDFVPPTISIIVCMDHFVSDGTPQQFFVVLRVFRRA